MTDNFSKIASTVALKDKNAQTMKDSFENSLIYSKRKPSLRESDDGKEFVDKIFTNLLFENIIKTYSRYTSLGAVFAEMFNRTIRDLLKTPVFEKGERYWIYVLATITEQYNSRVFSSTKITPTQASLKKKRRILL